MNCSIKKKLFKKLQNHKEFQRIITKVVNNNVQQSQKAGDNAEQGQIGGINRGR